MKKDNDLEIIAGIQAGGRKQEKAIRLLYEKYFHLTYDSQKKFSRLSREELISAYNFSVLAIRRQVVSGNFRGESSLWTFLNTIFFRNCIDILRKRPSKELEEIPDMPDWESPNPNALQQVLQKERFDRLIALLDKLGEPCKQIILDAEYHGYASEEIAQRIGFSNARSVNSKKYSCMQRLREMLNPNRQ